MNKNTSLKTITSIILFLLTSFSVNASTLKTTITPQEYIEANPSTERKAIISFLINQFQNLSKITQSQLDEVWNDVNLRKELSLARFQIINNQIYADFHNPNHYYFITTLKHFEKVTSLYKINNVDLLIYIYDGVKKVNNPPSTAPYFFAFSKNKHENALLLPDPYLTDSKWGELVNKICKKKTDYPWHRKIAKIFWKGSTSGGEYEVKNIPNLPRAIIGFLSIAYPDYINASYSDYVQFPDNLQGYKLKKIMTLLFPKNSYVSEEDHLAYKYLISIDGNTCAWKRVPWILSSNSLLIKQDSNNIQWFYPAMVPYKNFIPVNHDLSNILDQLNWLKENDAQAITISKNGRNFIHNELMPNDIIIHTTLILNEYSKLFSGPITKINLPTAEVLLKNFENYSDNQKKSKWRRKIIKSWNKHVLSPLKSIFY